MLYLFDKNENLIRIVGIEQIHSAIQTEQLNSIIQLDVELKENNYRLLKEIEYIGHFGSINQDDFFMYKIVKNGLSDNSTITAIHVVFDELKGYGYIRDKRPKNVLAGSGLGVILDGTRWKVGNVYTSKSGSTNWYDKTRLEALSDFINKWRVELRYRLVFDGVKITDRFIDIYDKVGIDTGKRLVYGSNAIDIKLEESKNVYTAYIGRGKGEEITDSTGEATGGYGRKIRFTDVVWSKSTGDPVDKPKGQEFVEIPEATKLYGYSDGTPRSKIVEFSECTDPTELLRLTYTQLKQDCRPQVTFESTVNKIGTVSIGDSVNIIRKDLDIFYTARIFKLETDLLNPDLTRVTLGDYIPTSQERQRNSIKSKLDYIEESINYLGNNGKRLNNLVQSLQAGLTDTLNNEDGFNYELKSDNPYNLPAGYYSFNRAINDNPTKVIYVGAGKFAIANKKKSTGEWDWRTFGTGDGFVADSLVAGTIKGGNVKWNLEEGTFTIGQSEENYLLKFDGNSLKFGTGALTSKDLSSELKRELKGEPGRDGVNGAPGERGPQGPPGESGNVVLPDSLKQWAGKSTEINGKYIFTPELFVGNKIGTINANGIYIGENIKVYHQKSSKFITVNGIVGAVDGNLNFMLTTEGMIMLGAEGGKQIILYPNGEAVIPKIKSHNIWSDAIQSYHINSDSIESKHIKADAITSKHIESDSIKAKHLESGTINTDILEPGAYNRIILESGYSAGNNNCKQIDTNNDGIRLKANSSTYVNPRKSGIIDFYVDSDLAMSMRSENWSESKFANSGSGSVTIHASDALIRAGWVLTKGIANLSDIKTKENIKFLDSDFTLRENKEKSIKTLTSSEIENFIDSIRLATYSFKEGKSNNISLISQSVEKYDKIKDYLLIRPKESDNTSIDLYNYTSMLHVALQEKDKKINGLEQRIEVLEKAILKGGGANE